MQTVINRDLDHDVRAGLLRAELEHAAGVVKARASNGSWVAGLLAITLLSGLIAYGLIRELAAGRIHARTCEGVLLRGQLDSGTLEFLSKHCVGR